MNKLFNIEDFDDFRNGMINNMKWDIMTGELPDATTVEEINAVADEIERLLELNSTAIYGLLPLDDNPDEGSLMLILIQTLGGLKYLIEVEVSNVGSEDYHFFSVVTHHKKMLND